MNVETVQLTVKQIVVLISDISLAYAVKRGPHFSVKYFLPPQTPIKGGDWELSNHL